jgi:hypothetical protein
MRVISDSNHSGRLTYLNGIKVSINDTFSVPFITARNQPMTTHTQINVLADAFEPPVADPRLLFTAAQQSLAATGASGLRIAHRGSLMVLVNGQRTPAELIQSNAITLGSERLVNLTLVVIPAPVPDFAIAVEFIALGPLGQVPQPSTLRAQVRQAAMTLSVTGANQLKVVRLH